MKVLVKAPKKMGCQARAVVHGEMKYGSIWLAELARFNKHTKRDSRIFEKESEPVKARFHDFGSITSAQTPSYEQEP